MITNTSRSSPETVLPRCCTGIVIVFLVLCQHSQAFAKLPYLVVCGGWRSCHDRNPDNQDMRSHMKKLQKRYTKITGRRLPYTITCYDEKTAKRSNGANVAGKKIALTRGWRSYIYYRCSNMKSKRTTSLDTLIDKIVERAGNRSLLIVGHSYGGALAIELVKKIPKTVDVGYLVTIDPISPDDYDYTSLIGGVNVAPKAAKGKSGKAIRARLGRQWLNFYCDDSKAGFSPIKANVLHSERISSAHYNRFIKCSHTAIDGKHDVWKAVQKCLDSPYYQMDARHSEVYLFAGDRYYRADAKTHGIVQGMGYPRPIKGNWRNMAGNGVTAALQTYTEKGYLINKGIYWRFDARKNDVKADKGYPLSMKNHFGGTHEKIRRWKKELQRRSTSDPLRGYYQHKLNTTKLQHLEPDAAFRRGIYVYFFKGTEYWRYNLLTSSIDKKYPRQIAKWWKGVWSEGITGALEISEKEVLFFKGNLCQSYRYDLKRASQPVNVSQYFAGLPRATHVNAAMVRTRKKVKLRASLTVKELYQISSLTSK